MTTTVERLARQVQGEIQGDRKLQIHGAEPFDKAGPHDVTFIADGNRTHRLRQCTAGAVLVGKTRAATFSEACPESAMIVVDDPQAAFIEVLQELRPRRSRPEIGISPNAFVAPSARVGSDTNIHPGASIGEDVVIGDHCDIHAGVSIEPGCRLGDHVTLHPNAVLYAGVTIGDRVTIHASAVIGADGFGYRFVEGRYVRIPHLGSVRIEDDVEIGACTTVDRGMIGATVIGEGTKLDNLIMIAHNCELGKHNAFASQVGFAGSITTGDYVRCGGQVGVANHVRIGTGSTLGAKAAVHKDVPDGETHVGYPARPEGEQMRILTTQVKLPEMRKKLRALESQVAELTARLESLGADRDKP